MADPADFLVAEATKRYIGPLLNLITAKLSQKTEISKSNPAREQLTSDFLSALYEEYERDPLSTHWVKREEIWRRVLNKYRNGVDSELMDTSFKHLLAGRLLNQVEGTDVKIQINERGLKAYHEMRASSDDLKTSTPATDPRVIFVVHGRNSEARNSMFDFLRALGLKPLEWSQAITAPGEASPYIGQVLDTAFSMAQAVVVLMTPDDVACLQKEFQTADDPPHEKQPTGQARPNVLFEAGMAFGRHPKRTVLVELGVLRPFSDVGGRHVLRLNNSSQRRHEFGERLRNAGCLLDLSGTDWYSVGNFELALTVNEDTADQREYLALEQGVYWEYRNGQKTSDGPFCQVCFDREGKAIHLQDGDEHGGRYRWFCFGCHNGFGAGEGPGTFSSFS